MNYRKLGKTGLNISEISLGTWQVGGKWGSEFSFNNAEKIINSAIDNGINFIDTADVYSEGLSEKAVGKVIRTRSEEVFVATKCGRQLNPHINASYTTTSLRKFVEDSLSNLGLERIDLIQLHCPPTEVYSRPEIFGLFNDLTKEGKIRNYGVSVEKVEEALMAIEFEGVSTVQIIYNMFRQKPNELFFKEAKKKNVGIIARVPLASGLLTGKFNKTTTFEKNDHRFFNRNGEAFDKGETFSGIDYHLGLQATEELKKVFNRDKNLVHKALQWILSFNEISCVIPGASNTEQLLSNLNTLKANPISKQEIEQTKAIYDTFIKSEVHNLW
ncbi:aldo/keto reductase [Polaribacter reichenbachii]|uniref:Aldo/keto reductase n=1 Tax=Polaribacter reichenbachii TaxID=996801 RepID=A0A1B8TYE7_9FLAO|nr:aldo/keto reductase [Polaribacter reichenbachii]APZ45892.1 aldo/keto reductase [Polaribacter reichenbachii]AUC19754.1 aldo/keto reductase [Polaribacter reichenbachii]OBY64677.1 aldo/keto reductase [Polaribacter reichenbachii]